MQGQPKLVVELFSYSHESCQLTGRLSLYCKVKTTMQCVQRKEVKPSKLYKIFMYGKVYVVVQHRDIVDWS